jgi:hypothetical protein
MAIDVTTFINNLVKNNPNVSANVKQGVSSATALFASLESGNLNASQLLDTSKLSASDQANLARFNSVAGTIQSGGTINPASFVDTSKLSSSDKANLAAASSTIALVQSGDVTSLLNSPGIGSKISGAIGNVTANIKSGISALKSNIAGTSKVDVGITESKGKAFNKGLDRSGLETPLAPKGIPLKKIKDSVPILLQSEVRALMLQIAYMQTSDTMDYKSGTNIGRYAISQKTLKNYGYMFSGNTTFTGEGGVKSEIEFLYDTVAQDRIMERFLSDQYTALIKNGGIKDGDKKEIVGGMLAVSYKFQDATPTLSSLTSVASIVSSATSLASGLQNSLSPISGATASDAAAQLSSSGIVSAAQDILNKNPTLPAATQGGTNDKSIAAAAKGILDTAKTTAESVKTALTPVADNMKQQANKAASSVEISKLKAAASEMVTMLPANAAKDWRNKGGDTATDFFNAGRYAINVLAADVPASTTSSPSPPTVVAI